MEKFTITITVTELDMHVAADEYNACLHRDEVEELGITWEDLEAVLTLCSYTEFVTSGPSDPEDPAEFLAFLADSCIY